ncbi:MAG TPA: site-2 protease family protein [Bacilli bacterium]|nr:site-2 protease family protein [Bacilli bacterium]
MLFSGLDMNDLLFRAIAFLIAITVHEFAHGFVAYKFGDPTPQKDGRLTLNPMAHLDVLGTIMILFAPFGWARPVRFNPNNFRGNKRVGKILTTLAGPVSNLLVAIFFAILFSLYIKTGVTDEAWNSFAVRLVNEVVWLNVILFIFNLLPIPPLDGYWIVRDLLPLNTAYRLSAIERFGPFILLLAIVLGVTSFVLLPLADLVLQGIVNLVGLG